MIIQLHMNNSCRIDKILIKIKNNLNYYVNHLLSVLFNKIRKKYLFMVLNNKKITNIKIL